MTSTVGGETWFVSIVVMFLCNVDDERDVRRCSRGVDWGGVDEPAPASGFPDAFWFEDIMFPLLNCVLKGYRDSKARGISAVVSTLSVDVR